jgi:Putative transposase
MLAWIIRRGLGGRDEGASETDAWADEAPVLAGLAAASVQGTVALGRQRGTRVPRLGDPPEEGEAPALGRCHAQSNGFDLHAGLVVPAGQREGLERVCRYALRPPVAQERLSLTGGGQVLLPTWLVGTTIARCSTRVPERARSADVKGSTPCCRTFRTRRAARRSSTFTRRC